MQDQIKKYYIKDLDLIKRVSDWVQQQTWYNVIDDSICVGSRLSPEGEPLDAEIPDDAVWNYIWRQAYGWDDASTQRRAPVIYELFQYVNREFLDNSFTLDGFGEEVDGGEMLWSDENHRDLPGWGEKFDAASGPRIWTAYANGRPPLNPKQDKNSRDKKIPIAAGPHRDWSASADTDPSEADGYYTILINLNQNWLPLDGGAITFHDTVPLNPNCDVHWKRGYGVGWPSYIVGHEPNLVLMYPATAIHNSHTPGKFRTWAKHKMQKPMDHFLQRVGFRIRKK